MNSTLVTYNRETHTFDVRIQVECPPDQRDDAMSIVETFVNTFTTGREHLMRAEPHATLSSPWDDEKVCRVYARFSVKAL